MKQTQITHACSLARKGAAAHSLARGVVSVTGKSGDLTLLPTVLIYRACIRIQRCHTSSFGHYVSSPWCIMPYTVCPCLVSCPFYAISIYPF